MVINRNNRQALKICLFVLIGIVALGIGYAAISNISLLINSTRAEATVDQNNFNVHFTSANSITGSTGVTGTATYSGVNAEFDITGLTKVGDYAIAKYTVRNDSSGIGAEISLNLSNSNSEYFRVTETIDDNKLQAGEETYATIRVEMIKTPVSDVVTTSVTAIVVASPLENSSATGGESKEVVKPIPLVYTIDGVDDIYINTDISDWTRVYNNFFAAKAEYGHPASLAHETENGMVTASYIAFERNGQVYYIKGRIKEIYSRVDHPVYDANILVLREAFGPDWQSVCSYIDEDVYHCGADGIDVYTTQSGSAGITASEWKCYISSAGQAYCR